MRPAEEAARFRSRGLRSGLVALALMFSAGIHAALVPEHLREMPPLGWLFIGAAALGAALACVLIVRPADRRAAKLAALFLAAEVLAWVLFVTVPVPGFTGTPEPIDSIALVCKVSELLGLGLALGMAWPARTAVGMAWPAQATVANALVAPRERAARPGSPVWGTPRSDPSAR